MPNLIIKKYKEKYKEKLSKVFGCLEFEPELCCFCHEVDLFVNKLSKQKHYLKFCQS